MSRPLLLLVALAVLLVVVLGGLASLDREVPQTRIEKPVANAPKI